VPTPVVRRRDDQAGVVTRMLRWTFRNRRTGRLTVAQWPNLVLSVFIVGTLVALAVQPTGRLHAALRVVTVVALSVWALDEMARGVNPFRRGLGAVVAAVTVISLLGWG
jgi:hypothetical protein